MAVKGGQLVVLIRRSQLSVASLRLTLFPFSIRARSQTATSPANLLNSRTWASRSADHLFTISSIVLPLSIEGGGTEMLAVVEVPDVRLVDGADKPEANVGRVRVGNGEQKCNHTQSVFRFVSRRSYAYCLSESVMSQTMTILPAVASFFSGTFAPNKLKGDGAAGRL